MFRALLGLSLIATPALASAHYQAQPSVAPAQAKLVLRDTVWTCGGDGCVAARTNSRPATVCALLARQVGALRSFSAGGKALPADQLAKCNARAE